MVISNIEDSLLPKGFNDILDRESEKYTDLFNEVTTICVKHGYNRIIPSTIEYFDRLMQYDNQGLLLNSIRFLDPVSGKILVLCPDLTIQIMRIYETKLKTLYAEKPARLYYMGSAFKFNGDGYQDKREVHQVGVEILGVRNVQTDQEIISIALELFSNIQIRELKLVMSLPNLTEIIINSLSLSPEDIKILKYAICNKNTQLIEDLQEKYNDKVEVFNIILEYLFPLLYNMEGFALLLKKLEIELELQGYWKEFLEYLHNCEGIKEVVIDLFSESNVGNYYTDFIFSIYANNSYDKLLVGGRYVSNKGSLGCGFSFDIDKFLEIIR